MSLALDCSMALSWFFEGEAAAAARSAQSAVVQEGAVVPALWHLEVGSGPRNAQRRRRVDAAFVVAALQDLEGLWIEVDDQTARHAWFETMRLAAAHCLTVYDASYLELALRLARPRHG